MLSAIYDLPPALSINDPAIRKTIRFNAAVIKYTLPGNYLVETFPWMKYLPSSIAKWKKEAEEGFKDYSHFFESMYNEVKDRIVMFPICFLSISRLINSRRRTKGTNARALLVI